MHKLLFGAMLALSLTANAQTLKIIGWQDGKEIIQNLSSENYLKVLNQTEEQFDRLISQELSDLENKRLGYKLSTICLGIGASGEIGLGPWKVGTGFRQRFYYKR